jgi:hypothetical protein
VGAVARVCIFSLVLLAGCQKEAPLRFKTLREHVGQEEQVALDVYFVGFPEELQGEVRARLSKLVSSLHIVDAKPWWIPNMPRYGAAEFSLAPAPPGLPPHLVPPDGMIRYDALSLAKEVDPNTGRVSWKPKKELEDLVEDWHRRVDIVHYVEHDGAYTNVPWRVGPLQIHFLPTSALQALYPRLHSSKTPFSSSNPPATYNLYSYEELFSWLSEQPFGQQPRGGATLVFLNLAELAGERYSFYADPTRDLVPAGGLAPAEVHYPPATATTSTSQEISQFMTAILGGGLTQPKMMAALEVECARGTSAAQAGLDIPGLKPTQPLCAQWKLEPIRNLLGNKGRRLFVSDTTRELAAFGSGQLDRQRLLAQVEDGFFELYRYGVLQTSIKANNVYSEAYELRTLVIDLRFDALELCLLSKQKARIPEPTALIQCQTESSAGHGEKTYELAEVFDVGLATRSLSQFNPGDWKVTFVPFPFGLMPDGTVDPMKAAQLKAQLRQFLNKPTLTDPTSGQAITLPHPPLYRTLKFPDGKGGLIELGSSWEKGLDYLVTTSVLTASPAEGGLGIHEAVWPDAQVVNARPFHETGKRTVMPLALLLTPPPDGPLGEKWGPFTINLSVVSGLGLVTDFGGGGFWVSVAGNELGGGILRRDFSLVVPQYILGKHRGNGSQVPYGVMPDGSVQPQASLRTFSEKMMDMGAPHWCDAFNSPDDTLRDTCRRFVRSTTTLQAIETLQHGLGYMHAPEPRKRYHYDGERSSLRRLQELLAAPTDCTGQLLHQLVNMYTTVGVSTVWGPITSEWNGVGPQAGMGATLHRSHAREELAAAERHLSYAISRFESSFPQEVEPRRLLGAALQAHGLALKRYDDWDYEGALREAMRVLSLLDQALTRMGEPERIHDPLTEVTAPASPPVIRSSAPIGPSSSLTSSLKEGSGLRELREAYQRFGARGCQGVP